MAGEAESDLDALVIPGSVKAAGAMLMGAGVCAAITGLQALAFFALKGPLTLVGPMGIALGLACLVLGWGVLRGRLLSASLGMAVAALTGLCALAWVVFALVNHALSLIALAVLPLSAVAVLMVGLGLKDIRKIDGARERLRAQGLDAGL